MVGGQRIPAASMAAFNAAAQPGMVGLNPANIPMPRGAAAQQQVNLPPSLSSSQFVCYSIIVQFFFFFPLLFLFLLITVETKRPWSNAKPRIPPAEETVLTRLSPIF